MLHASKRIVLYYPQQVDASTGATSGKDVLPLSLLHIAAWPARDGYEVVIIDGNLYPQAQAHRRVVEACQGALLYGTTGILGNQVPDGLRCTRAVKAGHPDLPAFIGGWFASVTPELQLATGLYDAVCLGQGELTFREIIAAVESGASLEGVAGLALLRDGQVAYTAHRHVAGWGELLDCPWHLLEIEPYRASQLAGRSAREVERMPTPPGHMHKPFFGISYYSSFGCPEACGFCCSPEVTDRRWKAMPAERMLDDLCGLQDRWGFDSLRFFDANFSVSEKRLAELAQGLDARGHHFWWYGLMQTSHIAAYQDATLDALRDCGMFCIQLGTETGDAGMMMEIGKKCAPEVNERAIRRLSERGVCSFATYIIGFPDESEESMMSTIDQCEQMAALSPLCRAMVWPFRPIPGTAMYRRSLELGFRPPATLEGWGAAGSYHVPGGQPWPGQIPERAARRRKVYEHFASLSVGLGDGGQGFWGRRARERVRRRDYRNGLLEARTYSVLDRLARGLRATDASERVARLSGYQTSVLAEKVRNGQLSGLS